MNFDLRGMKPEHVLLAILVFSLALRLYFFIGLNWSDDPGYCWDAYRIATGSIDVPRYLPGLRSMTTYPIAFFFSIFGVSNFSATIYPLLCSLGNVVLIFCIGKLLFDKKTGLIAAFLLSFYPLDVINATWIMPDVPIAFFMAISVFLFLAGEREKDGEKNKLYFLSGIFVGVAYLVRESGLMILFFFIPYMLYRMASERKIKFNYAWFFAGIVLVILLEGVFYSVRSGSFEDMTLRYRVVTSFYHKGAAGINSDLGYLPRGLLNLDNKNNFRWDNIYEVHYGLFYYLIIPAILYVLVARKKNAYVLVLWAVVLFTWSNFGSMSLTEYIPIHRLYRHLTIIEIPSILILGYVLGLGLKGRGMLGILCRFIFVSAVIFLLVTSLFYMTGMKIYLDASTYDVKEIYGLLKDLDEKPIYCDPGTGGHLNFYFKYQRMNLIKCLECVKNCDEIKDAYVITKGSRGYGLDPEYVDRIPKCAYGPPENWKLLKTIIGPKVDVFAQYDPQVYYVS